MRSFKKVSARSYDDAETIVTKELWQWSALQFVGMPYRWGGDDTIYGFDCCGLAQELQAMLGIDPPGDQTAHAFWEYWSKRNIEGPRNAGTLLFYGTPQKIIHVATCIDKDTIIEAGGGNELTTSIEAAARQNAYSRVRSTSNRLKDLVAVVNPKGIPWLSL